MEEKVEKRKKSKIWIPIVVVIGLVLIIFALTIVLLISIVAGIFIVKKNQSNVSTTSEEVYFSTYDGDLYCLDLNSYNAKRIYESGDYICDYSSMYKFGNTYYYCIDNWEDYLKKDAYYANYDFIRKSGDLAVDALEFAVGKSGEYISYCDDNGLVHIGKINDDFSVDEWQEFDIYNCFDLYFDEDFDGYVRVDLIETAYLHDFETNSDYKIDDCVSEVFVPDNFDTNTKLLYCSWDDEDYWFTDYINLYSKKDGNKVLARGQLDFYQYYSFDNTAFLGVYDFNDGDYLKLYYFDGENLTFLMNIEGILCASSDAKVCVALNSDDKKVHYIDMRDASDNIISDSLQDKAGKFDNDSFMISDDGTKLVYKLDYSDYYNCDLYVYDIDKKNDKANVNFLYTVKNVRGSDVQFIGNNYVVAVRENSNGMIDLYYDGICLDTDIFEYTLLTSCKTNKVVYNKKDPFTSNYQLMVADKNSVQMLSDDFGQFLLLDNGDVLYTAYDSVGIPLTLFSNGKKTVINDDCYSIYYFNEKREDYSRFGWNSYYMVGRRERSNYFGKEWQNNFNFPSEEEDLQQE